MIGRTISNFEIVEKLGSGGMGVVYLARDTVLNRPAALKFLPSHLAADEDAKARFIQEAQAASALDHANICSIYQIGETEDGELFIAMAHYEGQTLKYRLQNEEFPVERALDIGTQLARGLMRAHEAGIVHRDVKPANIMVTDRGEVKLLDFGLAKLATGAQLTKSGSTLGTAAYMSPEQYRGEAVGPAADVWSLGVVLYEMLTGATPFAGDYEQALMYSVLNTEADAISAGKADVPPELAEFVMGCLAKDPKDRPPLNDLVAPSGGSGVVAAPARPVDSEARADAGKSRIVKPLMLAAAVVIVVAAALAVILTRPDSPLEGEPPVATTDATVRVAVLPFTVRGNPDIEYLGQGMVDILATKLDGAGSWRTVDPRAVLGSLGGATSSIDPAAGSDLAVRLDAGRFILGSIIQAGERLQVRASVYESGSSPEPVSSGSVEGPADELFSLIDELAAQLLVGGEGDPGQRVTQLAAVTTASLPALKSYLEGEAHFRAGRYRHALEAFQHATELDSTFALAWYRVSVAAEWNAQGRIASYAAEQASRYSSRMSKHDRDLLETLATFRRGEALESEKMYRTIVALYPEDVEAWFQLGELLYHQMPIYGHSAVSSREAWERVLTYEPDHLQALWHLFRIAALERQMTEMDSLVERIVSLNPGGDRLVEILALQAGIHRDETMKAEVLRRMESASEASVALAVQFTERYSNDPPWAKQLARTMQREIHSTEHRVAGYIWEGFMEVGEGRLQAARELVATAAAVSEDDALLYEGLLDVLPFAPAEPEAIDETLARLRAWDAASVPAASNPQSWHTVHDGFRENVRLYLLGLLSLEKDDVNASKEYVRRLDGLPTPQALGSIGTDLVLSLRANIAVAEDRWEDGLDLLSQQRGAVWYNVLMASPFVSLCRDRLLKAQLLRRAGRYTEAVQLFGSFSENSVYDAIFDPPSHLYRAEIYEERGEVEKAAEHYRRVIEMWSDADVQLQPTVDRARERLEALGM
jgi:tetratricopeptide (TPR) repeat protein